MGMAGSSYKDPHPSSRERRSWHEAGHAVLHVLADVGFRSVDLGGVRGSSLTDDPEDLRRDLPLRFGGCVAEALHQGMDADEIHSMHPLVELCGSPRGGCRDRSQAREWARLIAEPELGLPRSNETVRRRAWELVREAAAEAVRALSKPEILERLQGVAVALDEAGELSEGRVPDLCGL